MSNFLLTILFNIDWFALSNINIIRVELIFNAKVFFGIVKYHFTDIFVNSKLIPSSRQQLFSSALPRKIAVTGENKLAIFLIASKQVHICMYMYII